MEEFSSESSRIFEVSLYSAEPIFAIRLGSALANAAGEVAWPNCIDFWLPSRDIGTKGW